MSDSTRQPTNARGSLDDSIGWRPPHVEPVPHDDPAMRRPDVRHDIPGAVEGGEPSTGWSLE